MRRDQQFFVSKSFITCSYTSTALLSISGSSTLFTTMWLQISSTARFLLSLSCCKKLAQSFASSCCDFFRATGTPVFVHDRIEHCRPGFKKKSRASRCLQALLPYGHDLHGLWQCCFIRDHNLHTTCLSFFLPSHQPVPSST